MLYRTPSAEILRELSDSRYTVYDVLPAFFSHADPVVTLGQFSLLVDYLGLMFISQLHSRFMSVARIARTRCCRLIMRKVMAQMTASSQVPLPGGSTLGVHMHPPLPLVSLLCKYRLRS